MFARPKYTAEKLHKIREVRFSRSHLMLLFLQIRVLADDSV